MLGDSTVLGAAGSSADAAAKAGGGGESHEGGETSAAATAAGGAGGVRSDSGDDERGGGGEEGDRSFGGNRWPRQETLSLLKIRSDMDVAFRDASMKGPLWEEVSRKLAEFGYNRSAKKCKEKFENVYKYHKRTKEGRTGKPDGKAYRFFDQLEALENLPSMHSSSIIPSKPQGALQATPLSVNTTVATTMASVFNNISTTSVVPHVTVPSTTATTIPMTTSHGIVNPSMNLTFSSYPPPPQTKSTNLALSMANPIYPPPPSAIIPSTAFQSIPADMLSNSSSSSTSSDEELEGRRKRKRKWKDFFERLMKEVIDKQEDLQNRFLEAIEKREHDRMVREESWRSQEMVRMTREREILAQERSIAAAKDAAVMSFLQKIAEQHNLGQALNNINLPQPPPAPPQVHQQPTQVPPPPQQVHPQPFLQHQQKQGALTPSQQQLPQPVTKNVISSLELTKPDNSDQDVLAVSSSRWPKVEVEALIKLRTSLDAKYQENAPKGPLWEEISAAMRKIGYNRNAKRCKEKWENINKYFKKVKDNNKKRPEDSKTCPYFHLLDALYKEKNIFENSTAGNNQLKPESLMSSTGAPLMVRPEQQWPPSQDMRLESTGPGQERNVTMEDLESTEPMEGHHEEEDDDDEDKDGDDEDEEDEGGCNFEIVASKPASVGAE